MTKYKILIIDDDPIIRKAYATILKAAGYAKVTTAENGKEGLRQAKKLQPDLIIVDIVMPEVDGIMFLRKFQPESHPETKIIVLSSSATSRNVTEAFRLGVRHYIVKTDLKPRDVRDVIYGILEAESF